VRRRVGSADFSPQRGRVATDGDRLSESERHERLRRVDRLGASRGRLRHESGNWVLLRTEVRAPGYAPSARMSLSKAGRLIEENERIVTERAWQLGCTTLSGEFRWARLQRL
jgi:hypothetical protein